MCVCVLVCVYVCVCSYVCVYVCVCVCVGLCVTYVHVTTVILQALEAIVRLDLSKIRKEVHNIVMCMCTCSVEILYSPIQM